MTRRILALLVALFTKTLVVAGEGGSFTTPTGQRAALIGVLHGQQPARTTKDGVFTEEQAGRGRALYKDRCQTCHGAELMGIEAAAPLAGFMFQADWNAATLGELFERILDSMPKDNPGILSARETADIVAFILSANKLPAGQAELSPDTSTLNAIKIEIPLGR